MTKMLENIEAVIFDMDGTLLDSMWIWPSIDDVFLEKYGLDKPEGFQEGMEGKSYTETAQYFLDLFPSLTQTREEVMEEWNEMAHDRYVTQVPLKEGAKEFILSMREAGVKTGIATSNSRTLVDDTLKTLGIEDLFDSVRTSCEAGAGKPAPDVYLLVAEDLKVNPNRCLVFEDVSMGIMAGKNAGMKTCAVEDDFSRSQIDKKRELADYYIKDFTDIKNETYEVL